MYEPRERYQHELQISAFQRKVLLNDDSIRHRLWIEPLKKRLKMQWWGKRELTLDYTLHRTLRRISDRAFIVTFSIIPTDDEMLQVTLTDVQNSENFVAMLDKEKIIQVLSCHHKRKDESLKKISTALLDFKAPLGYVSYVKPITEVSLGKGKGKGKGATGGRDRSVSPQKSGASSKTQPPAEQNRNRSPSPSKGAAGATEINNRADTKNMQSRCDHGCRRRVDERAASVLDTLLKRHNSRKAKSDIAVFGSEGGIQDDTSSRISGVPGLSMEEPGGDMQLNRDNERSSPHSHDYAALLEIDLEDFLIADSFIHMANQLECTLQRVSQEEEAGVGVGYDYVFNFSGSPLISSALPKAQTSVTLSKSTLSIHRAKAKGHANFGDSMKIVFKFKPPDSEESKQEMDTSLRYSTRLRRHLADRRRDCECDIDGKYVQIMRSTEMLPCTTCSIII